MSYKAFQGPNGWYVALEDDEGFHHQPSNWSSAGQLDEGEAKRRARERERQRRTTPPGA